MILVIDNYDSFTYNLVQYFGELKQDVKIFRNDEISVNDIEKLEPSHIVISPGPSEPKDAGISKDVIKYFAGKKPILGVCLGHQCIGEVFGAKVVRAPYLMHGKVSNIIYKEDEPLFKEMPFPFVATRYHSLIIDKDSLKETPLEIIAWTSDNLVMAVRHKVYKNLLGVQFHPEAVLTEKGHTLLKNFMAV
ncbi:MAG: aminodeoxychorismate/anthranilate synthase component II [Candidatus Gastranaerophilaceae bacterium]|jgi:anthranilate synthase/aminodeoxychorismate synthase-like glutamine amidotransferase